jgi:hypothetical protein
MHITFRYRSLREVRDAARWAGVSLPLSENLPVLNQSVDIAGKRWTARRPN